MLVCSMNGGDPATINDTSSGMSATEHIPVIFFQCRSCRNMPLSLPIWSLASVFLGLMISRHPPSIPAGADTHPSRNLAQTSQDLAGPLVGRLYALEWSATAVRLSNRPDVIPRDPCACISRFGRVFPEQTIQHVTAVSKTMAARAKFADT